MTSTPDNLHEVLDDRIAAAILVLDKRAVRSRTEGIIYLVLVVIIAIGVVVYFGTVVSAENIINIQPSEGYAGDISVDQNTSWTKLVGDVVLRLGAVLLAVFLIQILVSFSRYRFRISDLLYSQALVLSLARDDTDKMKIFSAHLSAGAIEFGMLPQHPYSEAFNTVDKLVSKIPKAK